MGYLPFVLEEPVAGIKRIKRRIKRLLTNWAAKDDRDHTAKRPRGARTATALADGAAGPEERERQPAGFNLLPNELKLAVIREVAYQPNRIKAGEELANLGKTDTLTRALIDKTVDLKESWEALGRNRDLRRGGKSRHVAVCHDVINGIPVKDAIRQNGPLSKDDNLTFFSLRPAMLRATYQNLADLAETFAARGASPNDAELLKGVASKMAEDFASQEDRLSELNIEQSATFARAFSGNTTNYPSMFALSGLGETVQRYNRISQANIQQIAALADAFGTKDGKNYAQRVVSSQPQPTIDFQNMLAQEAERFHSVANEIIETLASHVNTRGDQLLSQANSREPDTAHQLGAIKQVFEACGTVSCHSAVAKIDDMMKTLGVNARAQLQPRERSRSQSAIGL